MNNPTLPRVAIAAAAIVLLIALSITVPGVSAADEEQPQQKQQQQQQSQKPLVVFLVRHAEKAELSRDPELSSAGHDRAQALAEVLRAARIEFVHSSDFIRTRDSAAPTAALSNLTVELYDHGDLPALVDKLRSQGGRHLVVGHSTTTPAMAELLGGEAAEPIDEHGEFDRLYIVTIGADGKASTVLLRYGIVFTPENAEQTAPAKQ